MFRKSKNKIFLKLEKARQEKEEKRKRRNVSNKNLKIGTKNKIFLKLEKARKEKEEKRKRRNVSNKNLKIGTKMVAKCNVDTEQAVVCLAGTCDVLKLQTPVSNVYQKTSAVMTQQQFAESKLLPKREYQKELSIASNWMLAPSGQSSPGGSADSHHPPFHQHGDVGFCENPLEPEGGSKLGGGLLLKHGATRSYSSNPREFFKFGRKPTLQPKARGTHPEMAESNSTMPTSETSMGSHPSTSGISTNLRYRKSGGSSMSGRNSMAKDTDRRKSLGAEASAATPMDTAGTPTGSGTGEEGSGRTAESGRGQRLSSAALAVGLVAPSDIPYCGEIEPSEEPAPLQEICSRYSVPSSMAQHESITFTKSAAFSGGTSSSQTMRIVKMNEEEEVKLPRIPCWRR